MLVEKLLKIILSHETVAVSGWEIFKFNTTLCLLGLVSLFNKVQNKFFVPVAEYNRCLSHRTWRLQAGTDLEESEVAT